MQAEPTAVVVDLEGWTGIVGEQKQTAIREADLVALAPIVLAAARYLVRSEADATDLAQATLEIGWRHRDQLRDTARLRAWLLAIETREAFRLRRRLRSLVSLDGHVVEAPVAGPSADDLEVRLAVAKLPERMRASVVLHHMVGLSVADTAEAMRVSENTVKTLLRLGLARLREVLA
jgi:RNA polymerase sigma-70 factor (ECF subfamily)